MPNYDIFFWILIAAMSHGPWLLTHSLQDSWHKRFNLLLPFIWIIWYDAYDMPQIYNDSLYWDINYHASLNRKRWSTNMLWFNWFWNRWKICCWLSDSNWWSVRWCYNKWIGLQNQPTMHFKWTTTNRSRSIKYSRKGNMDDCLTLSTPSVFPW